MRTCHSGTSPRSSIPYPAPWPFNNSLSTRSGCPALATRWRMPYTSRNNHSVKGVPAKPVILQFAKANTAHPNPTTTAMLRAGDLAEQATYYRHDLAFAMDPAAVPKNPHVFLYFFNLPFPLSPLLLDIALGAQEQIAEFFASDGGLVMHPEPAQFFAVPIVPPLPEELNFIP